METAATVTATAYVFSVCLTLLIFISRIEVAALAPAAGRSGDAALFSLEEQLDFHVKPASSSSSSTPQSQPLMVPLTLLPSAITSSKGAGN